MKKLLLLCTILFLFFAVNAHGITLYMSTGFELNVDMDAKVANNEQFFKDCSGSNTGCVDQVTGDNIPYGFPGRCQSETCTEGDGTPYFNFVTDDVTDNEVWITTEGNPHSGTYALRINHEGNWDTSKAANGRVQLNVQRDSGAANPHDFSRTVIKYWTKWTQLPGNGEWLMIAEWTGTPTRLGCLMFNTNVGGTTYFQYFGGATSYSAAPSSRRRQIAITKSDWENKWVEVIVFHETGSSANVIVKFKLEGEAEEEMINFSQDNSSTYLLTYMPIKSYGTSDQAYMYIDDFKWYTSSGYTDLPDWDTDAVAPTPDPATWLVEPVGASTTTMTMTATTGMDVETPILYQFVVDPAADSCAAVLGGAAYGTGGTTGTWQASPTYVDEGLQLNRGYCYNVQMKDDLGNTGTAGTTLHGHTWAATPGASTLGGATDTTLDITEVDENSNTAGTYIAVQVTSSVPYDADWDQKWVNDADGTPEAAEQWIGFETWDADVTVVDLNLGTEYCFKAKAINAFNVQTALGPEVCLSTTGSPVTPPDVSAIGVGAVGVKFD